MFNDHIVNYIESNNVKINKVRIDSGIIILELNTINKDCISFNASDFNRLKNLTDEELGKVIIRLDGEVLSWEEVDEDLSLKGLIRLYGDQLTNKP